MYTINKFNHLVSATLLITIIFFSAVTCVAAPSPTPLPPEEHQATIRQFISEIRAAQEQSAHIAQTILQNISGSPFAIQLQINTIGNTLQVLNEKVEDYADIIEGLNEQDRQIRLTFNYLNLVRSNLHTLTLLARAQTDFERIQLLDEFFRTRINAVNVLTILEETLR